MSGVSYPRRTELARGGPGAFAVAAALVAGFLFVGGAVYVALSGTAPLSNPGSSNIALGPTPHSSLAIFVQPTPTPSPEPTVEITPWFFSPSPSVDLSSPSFSIEPFPSDTPFVTPTVGPPGTPVANFRGTITSADGLTVAWHDLSTGTVSQWTWDFGDGTGSQVQNPTHRYPHLGDYQVTLSVGGPLGSDSSTKVLHLRAGPTPTPTPTPPQQISAGFVCSANASTLSVSCDGSNSTGTINSYSWTWGDGGSGSGKTAGHTYAGYGDYTITLTVSGPAGSDSRSKVLHLNPQATPTPTPSVVARFTWAQEGDTKKVDFDATTSSGDINSYSWNFGDPASGTDNTATGEVVSHTFTSYGPQSVKLTVSGPDGSATRTHTFTISGPGPTPQPTDTPPPPPTETPPAEPN